MKKFPFTRIKEETRILVDEGDAITESLFRGLDREKRETLGRRHVVLMDRNYSGRRISKKDLWLQFVSEFRFINIHRAHFVTY